MKLPNNYKKDVPLVLYGAGLTAGFVYESFLEHGVKAVCFADGDKNKQGRPPYRGSDLITYSIDEVKKMYPDFQIFVTAFGVTKFSIIDFLVSKAGINRQVIINYEPYTKRLSCKTLEDNFFISEDFLCICLPREKEYAIPPIPFDLENIGEAVNSMLKSKYETIAGLQIVNDKHCSYLKEIFASENNNRFCSYGFCSTPKSICNLKCSYCNIYENGVRKTNVKESNYQLIISEYLEKKGLIAPEFTTLTIGDGEITVMANRNEQYRFISKYNTQIFTNAVIYSEEIAELLRTHKTRILVSVDSGTRETFAKVKGIDAFDKVSANLIRYGETNGNIVLKYIFIPEVNDNDDDLDGFLELARNIGVEQIRLSLDFNYDYLQLKTSGTLSNILNYADKCRNAGFVVDSVESNTFRKQDCDAIKGELL